MVLESQKRPDSENDELINFFGLLKKQAALLEKLREKGVVSIIEDVTKQPIVYPAAKMTFQQFVYVLQNPQETYDSLPYMDRWSMDIWAPPQTSDGSALVISLAKAADRTTSLVHQVVIIFHGGKLEIFGANISFDGFPSKGNNNVVQTALQEALDNPRIVDYKGEEYFEVPTFQ